MIAHAATFARHRWRSLVGTAVALLLGAGLLSATAVVLASSTAQPPLRYAAADVLVQAPVIGEDNAGYPEHRPWSTEQAAALTAALARVDGTAEVVADRTFPARVVGLPAERSESSSQGHNWSSLALSGRQVLDGRAPAGPDEIAAPASSGLRVGSVVDLFLAAEVRRVTVAATVAGSTAVDGVLLADDVAAELATGVGVIGVVGDADPAAVAATVAELDAAAVVHSGVGRAAMETEDDSRTRWVGAQLLGVMGVIAAFVSVFVVATTFAFVVTQRRREIGLLRAIGATPGQVRRLLLGEALAVGSVASTAGGVAGALAAPLLGDWMVDSGMQPIGWEPRTVVVPTAIAVLVGILVALVGAWSASRRASRIKPVEALREAAVERRPMTVVRWVGGVAAVVVGIACAALTPAATSSAAATIATGAVAALVTGAALLGPVWVPPAVRLLCLPWRRATGPTAELLREGTVTGVRRVASTAAPVLLTVTFAVLVTGLIETVDRAITAGDAAAAPGPIVVAPADGLPGVPAAAVAAVAAVAAEQRVLGAFPTDVVLDGAWAPAAGVLADDRAVEVVAGALDLGPAAIAVAERFAADRGLAAGDTVSMEWADGAATAVTVAAVVADAPAPVLLAWDAARDHDPAALVPAVYLDEQPSAAPAGARVVPATEYQSLGVVEEERLIRVFVAIMLTLVLGFTVLAIANTLVMATADRRRDFAVLRLAGASRAQVMRVVVAEAVVVVAIGSVVGGAAAVPGLLGAVAGLADDFVIDVSIAVPWPTVLGVVAVCLVVALLASVLPARAALRGSPTDPAGERD